VRESGGVSRQTIVRWASKKEIKAEKAKNGEWTVWLDDVLQRVLGGKPIDPEEYEDAISPTAMFAQVIEALKNANKHIENLIGPCKVVLDTLSDENAKLRTRTGELEDKLSSQADKWEQSLSLEHERRLEEERDKRAAERNEKVLKTLLDYAPVVLSGVAGHFGVEVAQEAVLVKMVNDLTDEQIGALLRSGALSPQNLAVLERIRATRKAALEAEAARRKAAADAANDGKSKSQQSSAA
jgi:hypothetical protein